MTASRSTARSSSGGYHGLIIYHLRFPVIQAYQAFVLLQIVPLPCLSIFAAALEMCSVVDVFEAMGEGLLEAYDDDLQRPLLRVRDVFFAADSVMMFYCAIVLSY